MNLSSCHTGVTNVGWGKEKEDVIPLLRESERALCQIVEQSKNIPAPAQARTTLVALYKHSDKLNGR